MGKIYQLDGKTIGRFLRRVEHLVCYRCGTELIENQWVFAKKVSGDCSILAEQHSGWNKNKPKVYHINCARDVNLVLDSEMKSLFNLVQTKQGGEVNGK